MGVRAHNTVPSSRLVFYLNMDFICVAPFSGQLEHDLDQVSVQRTGIFSFYFIFCFETESHVAQVSLKFTM